MKPKVSIIMPVYNSKHLLESSINSVLAQTLNELELIIINDGSTDGSKEVCEYFVEKDKRVRLISIDNSGSAVARNVGLEASEGEYIGFVDSDDFIDEVMFQELYTTAKTYECEMISCSFERVNENNKKTPEKTFLGEGFYNKEKIYQEIFPQLISSKSLSDLMPKTMWTKIFSRRFLEENNIKFVPELRMSQDVIFTTKCFLSCNSFYYLPKLKFYKYRYNENSRTHTYLKNAWEIMEKNFFQIKKMIGNIEDFDFKEQLPYALIRNAITAVTNEGREIGIKTLNKRLEKIKYVCNQEIVIKAVSVVKPKEFSLLKKVVFLLIKRRKYRTILFLSVLYNKHNSFF